MGDYLPTIVRQTVDNHRTALDIEPVVTRPTPDRWRITVANGRVTTTANFTAATGKVRWTGATLTVDGQARPLAKSWCHLAAIFRDPDKVDDGAFTQHGDAIGTVCREHIEAGKQVDPIPDLPPDIDVNTAPPRVRDDFRLITERIADMLPTTMAKVAGGEDHWVIAITAGDNHIRMSYVASNGPGGAVSKSVQVWVGDIDRTAEAKGDILTALSLMFPAADFPDAPPPTRTGPAAEHRQAAVNTGVTVRRQTVMRI